MNLTTNPWIPATRADGSRGLFSLQELFAEAHELRDLAVKPHERIALMRLLICITQAALKGPVDEEDWEECEPNVQPRVREYLATWSESFELFGEGARFLQLSRLQPGKETDEGNAATKLDLTLATGNNPTIFDNRASEERVVAARKAALNLLTFQCFSPGGRIGVARWNGTDTPGKGASGHAPCTPSSMIHSLVMGAHLLETIRFNLLSQETVTDSFGANKWGQPIWQLPVQSASDSQAIENATGTYLGRLVPLSRAIRLNEDGVSVILANGLEYPIYPEYREATATIRIKDKEAKLLPASSGRSIWRQLSAIVVKQRADGAAACGPLALRHDFGPATTLWVGAMITDKAKIEEMVESIYTLPSEIFSPLGRAAYETGVNFAVKWEFALRNGIKEYAKTLYVENPSIAQATRVFWTRLEQQLSDLFDLVRNSGLVADLPESPWGRAAKAAALDAYQQTCARETPRQIEAYARGLRRLYVHNETQPTPVENE